MFLSTIQKTGWISIKPGSDMPSPTQPAWDTVTAYNMNIYRRIINFALRQAGGCLRSMQQKVLKTRHKVHTLVFVSNCGECFQMSGASDLSVYWRTEGSSDTKPIKVLL